jgi:biotin carboxyl carrier protein
MEHLRITVDGKTYEVVVEKIGSESSAPPPRAAMPVASSAAHKPAAPAPPATKPSASVAAGDVPSPLAGIVQAIALAEGSTVQEGDEVLTLEAMKMYTPITATAGGTISKIHVKVGDAVEEGQPLYTIS